MQPTELENIDYVEIQRRGAELRAQALKDMFSWLAQRVRALADAVISAVHHPRRAQ